MGMFPIPAIVLSRESSPGIGAQKTVIRSNARSNLIALLACIPPERRKHPCRWPGQKEREACVKDLQLLVVDDDIPSLELMTAVFESLKARVYPVADSQEAAALVDQQKFDGIFLDLEMPHVHGLELTEKIRSSAWNKSTPVTVITGSENRRVMGQAFENGATFYVLKPIDRQRLTGLYRAVLGTLQENRRRYTRIPLLTDVACSVGRGDLLAKSCNLSQGGIQLEADDLQQGESLRLRFRLPGSNAMIETGGVIVWIGGERRGIQFVGMSTSDQAAIRDFIAQAV